MRFKIEDVPDDLCIMDMYAVVDTEVMCPLTKGPMCLAYTGDRDKAQFLIDALNKIYAPRVEEKK